MEENKKNIAYFSRRFIARIFDTLLILSFIILLFYLFFVDLNSQTIEDAIKSIKWNGTYIFSTKLLFLSIIWFLINYLYFIVLPTYWRGYTLFRRILKIRYYIYSDQSRFRNLFRAEIFIWVMPIASLFLFSLISFSVPNSLILSYSLISLNNVVGLPPEFLANQAYLIISNIFKIFFIASFLPSTIVLISSFIKTGKVTLNDDFAGIYCISTLDVAPDAKEPIKTFNNNVPGILDETEIDKITGEKNE